MKWLYKLERKFGKFCIPNLMMIIIIGQGMVYLANMLNPAVGIPYKLAFIRSEIFSGQVWRIFTFIFIPQMGSIFALAITLYLYYIIGHTLENEWGDFKFNVYYFCGVLGAVAAGLITGVGTNSYLNISLFLAFATLYPNFELLLFFILPVKMKYLAFMAGVYYILMFLLGTWGDKAAIIFSLINYFIFFGGGYIKQLINEAKYSKTRRQWRNNNQNNKW